MALASAVLMALLARERDGEGQSIDVSMLTANAYLMSDDWIRYDGAPSRPRLDADLLGTGPFDRLYEARDGWVLVCAPTAAERARLAALLGIDGADGAISGDDDAPVAIAAIAAAVGARGADELEDAALAAGVGCVRADRGGFVQWQQAEIAAGRTDLARWTSSAGLGAHWRAAPVVAMEGTDGPLGGATRPGQHTRAVLGELGYSADEIGDLVARRIVGEAVG
jgi:crotonobetainyl-CoA:carnitine CoA-transferase CaiB-like acyl-CoA transferase